jgi:hypothetical protein
MNAGREGEPDSHAPAGTSIMAHATDSIASGRSWAGWCPFGWAWTMSMVNAYNADVASPVDVQELWTKHGELPGFAAGT